MSALIHVSYYLWKSHRHTCDLTPRVRLVYAVGAVVPAKNNSRLRNAVLAMVRAGRYSGESYQVFSWSILGNSITTTRCCVGQSPSRLRAPLPERESDRRTARRPLAPSDGNV